MKDSRVLLTGATDGIGLRLANLLDARGAAVLMVGRRPEAEIAPRLVGRQRYVCADLSAKDGPPRVLQGVDRTGWSALDLLVHNAASGWVGPLETQPPDSVDAILQTNLLAPIELSHRLLPRLLRNRGKIVFIGSTAAARACPRFAVYGATKAALAGFARSLRVELAGALDVQVLHPGPTRTALHAKAGAGPQRLDWAFMDPDRMASAIMRAMASDRATANLHHGALLMDWLRTAFTQDRRWRRSLGRPATAFRLARGRP